MNTKNARTATTRTIRMNFIAASFGLGVGGLLADTRYVPGESARQTPRSWGCSDQNFSFFLLRPVTVEAMTTRTAATAMATIHRVQSMPALPLPPNAV